jgi:uncharacterized membrane protein YccF (DUF307 family)
MFYHCELYYSLQESRCMVATLYELTFEFILFWMCLVHLYCQIANCITCSIAYLPGYITHQFVKPCFIVL